MAMKRTIRSLYTFFIAVILLMSAALPGFALGGTTTAQTPISAEQTELKWSCKLKEADDWGTNISEPVVAADAIFIAAGSQLLKLNLAGEKTGQAALAGAIDYTCRPLALNGAVYVPLNGGRLQAIDAATLQSRWTTAALPEYDSMAHQSQTTLVANNGLLYFGTACADWTASYYGAYLCVGSDGTVKWKYTNENAGYYWSGAAFDNGTVLFAGDDGALTMLDAATGAELDALDLGAKVRAGVVVSGGAVYAVTQNGTLHRVALTDKTFGAHSSVNFAASSTSTPVIVGGKAYVGGGTADYKGLLAVIDTTTMTVVAGAAAPAAVQASPLAGTAYAPPVIYYTANAEPGGIYAYQSAAAQLFTPAAADQNYCMGSVAAGNDGTLYYTNDSGRLFAVAKKADAPQPKPEPKLTWLDKLPEWLFGIRAMKPFWQNVIYYVFFGWIWDVIK